MSQNDEVKLPFKVVRKRNLSSIMRDGTTLRADVYRPDNSGKYPVLLCRTPYCKDGENDIELGTKLAERGYVVTIQDVRGRYASEGQFQPGFYSADHRDDTGGAITSPKEK